MCRRYVVVRVYVNSVNLISIEEGLAWHKWLWSDQVFVMYADKNEILAENNIVWLA